MKHLYSIMTKKPRQGSFFDWRWCVVDVALIASAAAIIGFN